MSPEDQARYGDPGYHPDSHLDPNSEPDSHPPTKTNRLEREEQRQFVSWLMLNGLPFCWHATHKRSTANIGVPDFIFAMAGQTFWVEFKRPQEKLTLDQENFRLKLEKQQIFLFICYTADEAIRLVKSHEQSVR